MIMAIFNSVILFTDRARVLRHRVGAVAVDRDRARLAVRHGTMTARMDVDRAHLRLVAVQAARRRRAGKCQLNLLRLNIYYYLQRSTQPFWINESQGLKTSKTLHEE